MKAFGADSVDLSIFCIIQHNIHVQSLAGTNVTQMERSVVEYPAWENTSAQRKRSLLTFLALAMSKRARSLSWKQPGTQTSCLNGDTKIVALHEQLGRGDVENPSAIANDTGRTVRLKSS